MKLKKHILVSVVSLIGISLISSAAWAGSKQQHRWEGVAIGVGAAILGHAIIQAQRSPSPPPAPLVHGVPAPEPRHSRGSRPHRGHWECRKTWVPPTYERVWNPGHYNRHGHWVPGQWIDVKKCEGYWTQEQIWVADNHRH